MAQHPYIALERAMNTSTSTGTGNMVLGAAVDGYVTLDQSPLADDADFTFPYCIEGIDGACEGEVERGIGTIVSGELVRDAEEGIVAGEWASGAVTFSAGTKRVYLRVIPPASGSGSMIGALQNMHDTDGLLRCRATALTTNATPTLLGGDACFHSGDVLSSGATFSLTSADYNYPITFRLTVSARDSTYTDAKAWALDFVVNYPSGGGAADLIGSPTPVVIGASAGAAAWDVGVAASVDVVEITVTGAAATTISWKVAGTILL